MTEWAKMTPDEIIADLQSVAVECANQPDTIIAPAHTVRWINGTLTRYLRKRENRRKRRQRIKRGHR